LGRYPYGLGRPGPRGRTFQPVQRFIVVGGFRYQCVGIPKGDLVGGQFAGPGLDQHMVPVIAGDPVAVDTGKGGATLDDFHGIGGPGRFQVKAPAIGGLLAAQFKAVAAAGHPDSHLPGPQQGDGAQ